MLFMLEPSIRTKDIVVILELAASTIEKVIAKLKEDKVIEREGSTISEYWK
jgi:predicted HTH transcriptional regulator